MRIVRHSVTACALLSMFSLSAGARLMMRSTCDPITRLFHVTYTVPANSPPLVRVRCSWRPAADAAGAWQPARVEPLLSATAWELLTEEDWRPWLDGEILERRAAGLERTVLFNPYPAAQEEGRVNVIFRIEILGPDGRSLAVDTLPLEADNSDVVYLDNWLNVLQKQAIAAKAQAGKWQFENGAAQKAPPFACGGTRLHGPGGHELPPLTYPLDLRGKYAIFAYTCANSRVWLRLSGDERADPLTNGTPFHEMLWRWASLDRQHLVIRQNYAFTGPADTSLDYIKLVPLTPELEARLEAPFAGKKDKFVAAYWEPYSYAFSDQVLSPFWHREYLGAYREAEVSLVDMQVGRFGAKVVYESRIADQLLYQTMGDPIGANAHPKTTNVGRMQQYTNTLEDSLRYGAELGLTVYANFGATNCYPGSPLQGEFSKQHPEWMRGAALRYEVPEVRKFILSLYRETLEIGAPGISIDFCRYPEGIDSKKTATAFLRELRALADEFAPVRGRRVPILIRFPAQGVRRSEFFDFRIWAREGLVDYLCPSHIQGRFHYFDVTPYLEAVANTKCLLLPQLDGLSWGLKIPGPFLWRVARIYEKGVPGIYIYQGDAPIVASPEHRRFIRMLCRSDAVRKFWENEKRLTPKRSKNIYITHFSQLPGYHSWERLHIWTDGIPMGELEVFLDGKRVNHFAGPPYLLGDQGPKGDHAIPSGKHELKIRARDGDGWLERSFSITGA